MAGEAYTGKGHNMKHATILLFATACVAGCQKQHWTEYRYGSLRFAVAGRIRPVPLARTDRPEPGLSDGTVAALYDAGTRPRQVLLDVKVLSVDLGHNVLGVDWWTPGQELLHPMAVKDKTPTAPGVQLGMGFNLGGIGGGDRRRGSERIPNERRRGGSERILHDRPSHDGLGFDSGVGLGLGLPLFSSGNDHSTTAVQTTFEHPTLGEVVNDSYILITIALTKRSAPRLLIQPVLIPLRLGPVEQPKVQVETVQTQVSLPDGGTILLGGLPENQENNAGKLPILSKIPYISRLFRSDKSRVKSNELLLMVTPRVIIQEEE